MRIKLLLATLLTFATAVDAADVRGTLLVQWGDQVDREAGVETDAPVRVQLSAAGGYAPMELDAPQALLAAEDLYALNGRDVVATIGGAQKSDGARIAASIVGTSASKGIVEAVVEDRPWVVVLCRFADIADEPRSPQYFRSMFGYEPGQLGEYWDRMSNGSVQLAEGRVHGWFQLPGARTDYLTSRGGAALDKLMQDCIGAADAEVDFSAGVAGVLMMFNATLDCCAWAGKVRANLDGVDQAWRMAWLPPYAYQNVAGLAHEIGHTLGLPHSNNFDGDYDTYDNPWDLMSDPYRYAVADAQFGRLPKGLSAYQRDRLGWVGQGRKRVLAEEGTHRLVIARVDGGLESDAEMVEISWPPGPDARRLIVEARTPDTTADAALPGAAVIVHELDTQRREPGWSLDADAVAADYADNAGTMFQPGESWTAAGGALTLRVIEQTAEGFVVEVALRETIFGDGFAD